MTPDDIDALWHSTHNQPDPAQPEADRERLLATLRQRDRGFRLCLALALGWLTIVTARLLWVTLWPAPGRAPIQLSREWAVVLLLALPWLGVLLLVRQHRGRSARHPAYDRSIADSLRALVDQSRASAARVRTMLWLHVLGVPLLALCLRQIILAGKARPHEIPSMIAFFAGVVALSIGGLFVELWRQRGELRRLQGLLKEYADPSEPGGE